MERWGAHRPVWYQSLKKERFDILRRDIATDAVIVGGGITGLACALFLLRAGKKVVVVTDGEIGGGATGSSTGHLTYVQDYDFKELIGHHGEEGAARVCASSKAAINLIEGLSHSLNMKDIFQRVPGIKYTEDQEKIDKLKEEEKLAKKLELDVRWSEKNPFSFPIAGSIVFPDQGQVDPLRFVIGLVQECVKLGGEIFENSRVSQIEDGSSPVVHTDFGSVKAKNIVLATHTPVGVYISIHTRVAPYFSYVMGVRLQSPPPNGLYWDDGNPYMYLRPHQSDENLWLIGGKDHKTGQEPSTYEKYLELEDYIQNHFDVQKIEFYWGSELYEPVDNLPYIGKIPFTSSLYTGTGYLGTGLTYGILAGNIISDILTEKKNPYADLFDPIRVKPVASAPKFIKENINVAKRLLTDRVGRGDLKKIESIPPGEGRIVDIAHHKVAAYRDDLNHLHTFSPICTHMGCVVQWNTAEKTWDCPCHGGRFKCTGDAFEGPVLKDLENLPLEIPPLVIERESENSFSSASEQCLT